MKLCNIELGGISYNDSLDFCDAFIQYAEHQDGSPLSDQELDAIPADVVYEYVIGQVY